jgi:glycerophosphoryl diester phosphodiesterase
MIATTDVSTRPEFASRRRIAVVDGFPEEGASSAVQRPLRDPTSTETKHATYHKSLGLPLEGRLLRVLRSAGWDSRDAPVFIQSFEQSNLKELNKLTKIRLIQLVDANDVNPDSTLDYTAPFDRPFDWTASGDPRLLARTFGFFATDEGLREIKTYADGIGP